MFTSPSHVPAIAPPPRDTLAGDFVLDGHAAFSKAKTPFVCALSGRSYDASEIMHRVDLLARSLALELNWSSTKGTPWDKTVGIFSVNTIDYVILAWAVHRIGGLCLLLHATSSAAEIATHLERAPCQAIFTCEPLLATCTEATRLRSGASSKIFLLDVPRQLLPEGHVPSALTTLEQLVQAGAALDQLSKPQWKSDDGKDQVAYLCPTSGTSGTQKLAKITHVSLIANIIQTISHELPSHEGRPEVGLGFLPQSHVYGLALSHMMLYRGDTMVLHPQFDLHAILKSVAVHRIERLYLVPPVVGAFVQYPFLLDMNDLSSVTTVVSGAAPFSKSLADALHALRPSWTILPGWGLTEGGGVSSLTSSEDFFPGSSGPLLPAVEIRLIDAAGEDIKTHNVSGEILMKSPSLIQGYLHDATSDGELFTVDGWLRTGDVGFFQTSPKGIEHLFVVDRTKDMIKVKGMQVAPAEIENHLLLHSSVGDVAVIGIPDTSTGERPKAFIVLTKEAKLADDEESVRDSINDHVEAHLSQAHWLGERIEFLDQIPKSASGKILKRLLRDGTK